MLELSKVDRVCDIRCSDAMLPEKQLGYSGRIVVPAGLQYKQPDPLPIRGRWRSDEVLGCVNIVGHGCMGL